MKIYRNGVEIYEIKDFKVTGRFMEVATLDCTIKSPTPIAFEIGDYVSYDYNNLTYSLYDIPAPKKQARSGSYGEAFIYNLKFKSNMEHLVICPFLDLVANDNTLHYTSLPSFSTFENVYGIAARIQANMDYLYPGKWRIVVGETSDSELLETLNEAKEFAISGQSCFEGLKKIYDTWGVGYIYSEAEGINTITIGKSAGTTSVFRYGKGQGLRTIGKNIQNNDQFCTRAYVFGSTRNLPARWYNEKGYIGEAQYAPNLMIPFSKWVGGIPQGAYIDAIFGEENRVEKYGLRIKTFSYDGSGNNEEIYPSIEKVTAGNIRSAKAELGETKYIPSSRYSDSERMDYILEGSNISDDGVSVEAGYELYSEKLIATTKEVEETLIIAEPLKEEKYNRLEFQKNIPVCSFEITKLANYRITEVNDMVRFSKNDLESTINAKWYIQTPDGSYIDLNKSLTFTDKLNASLQLPDTNFNAREVGKYTLTLRLSIGWSVDYVVPQIDGDIFLKYSFSGDDVVIARGTGILDSTFTLKLKQIGFDINSVTASDGSKKTITMKDGMCGGRSFVINQCKYSASDDSWELVCSRTKDASVSQMFPNSIFPISTGDQFVLLNINMPDLYVYTAMQRLYDTALADLKHYSLPQFVVSPEIDNLQMARSPQILREGMYMPIEDSDIDIDEEILIDSVTITEKGTELRSFSVTLRNDKIYNRFSKIATSISSLESSIEEAKKNAANTTVVDDSSTEVFVNSNTTRNYFELTENDEVKVKEERPLIGKEARFESVALPKEAPAETIEGEVYGFISDRSNAAVDLTPLLKRINVGTEDNPQWAVIPIDYNGNPVGIVSDTFITAGGRGNSSDQGTATTLGGLVNVDDTADELQTEDVVLVKGVDATHWTLRALSTLGLNKTELESYLTTNSYLKKDTADGLYAPLASFNELNTKFNDFLTGSDTNNIIDKWKELEAFLAGQTETSTLADLLNIKADKTALQAHIDNYNYFIGTTYAAHISAYNTHITEYNTFKTDTQQRLNALEALWAIDEDNNGLYPKSGRGIWSESYITAGGIGTSAGDGGLIQNVYGFNSLGGTFDNTVLTDTFNAYTINYLYTEVEKLKSGGTGFSESAMWTALGGSDTNKVIASEHIPDLSGKYLPLSGGTISGNLAIEGFLYGNGIRFRNNPDSETILSPMSWVNYDLGWYNGSVWKTFAFLDSNVASATKLATARTIWGQSFDGTGNVDGRITINLSNTDPITILQQYSTEWASCFRALNSTMSSRQYYNLNIGRSSSAKNLAWLGFHYHNDGSDANRLSMGLYSVNDVLNITGKGNVGIGTTSPAYKLDVEGDFRALAFIATYNKYGNNRYSIELIDTRDYPVDIILGTNNQLKWGIAVRNESETVNAGSNGFGIYNYMSLTYALIIKEDNQIFVDTLKATTLYQGGQTLDKYYLPLSGGTISGVLNIYRPSGRSQINLVSQKDEPNDLYFGSNTKGHWSLTSRNSAENYLFALYASNYDSGVSTYVLTANLQTGVVNFPINATITSNQIIHSGNIGSYNAGSATKLQTARTIWGQSFDGTKDIDGALSVGAIQALYHAYRAQLSVVSIAKEPGMIWLGSNSEKKWSLESRGEADGYAFSIYSWQDTAHRVRILHSGNVGIGTTSPAYKLDVAGTGRFTGTLSAGATTVASLISNGNISATGSTILGYTGRFFEVMPRTDGSSGVYNLGSNDYRWTAYLKSADITGNIRLKPTSADYGNYLYFGDGSYCYIAELTDDKMTIYAGSGLQITANTNVSGNIYATGEITAGTASDRRLKDNIQSMTDEQATSVLRSLRPVTFNWNSKAYELGKHSGNSDGFIADEYEALIPNSGRSIWSQYRAINYERAISYVVKGWQNHETRLERLERENRELRAEVEQLKQYRRA